MQEYNVLHRENTTDTERAQRVLRGPWRFHIIRDDVDELTPWHVVDLDDGTVRAHYGTRSAAENRMGWLQREYDRAEYHAATLLPV